MQATENTPFMPSDLFLMMQAGTLFQLQLEPGRTLNSLASKSTISASLDILGQTQGQVIVRGATYWQALGPGASGQVLVSQGSSAPPKWAGSSAGGFWSLLGEGSFTGGSLELQGLSLSGFDWLKILLVDVECDASQQQFYFQTYQNGSLIITNNATRRELTQLDGNSITGFHAAQNVCYLNPSGATWGTNSGSQAYLSGEINFPNPYSGSKNRVFFGELNYISADGDITRSLIFGNTGSGDPITGIRFRVTGGNNLDAGKLIVLGG